jgi:hypothetical protein
LRAHTNRGQVLEPDPGIAYKKSGPDEEAALFKVQ